MPRRAEGIGREFKVTIDRDKRIGPSFIEAAAVKDLVVTHDVVLAKPGMKTIGNIRAVSRLA